MRFDKRHQDGGAVQIVAGVLWCGISAILFGILSFIAASSFDAVVLRLMEIETHISTLAFSENSLMPSARTRRAETRFSPVFAPYRPIFPDRCGSVSHDALLISREWESG
jgi:hypothetical protein